MKKIILIFGLGIGALLTANAIVHINMLYSDPNYKGNVILGYASLVIMFSLIYFGIKQYRNNHLDGTISFLNALKIGGLICLVASTIYTIIGLAYYHIFVPDFMDVYTEHVIRNSAPEDIDGMTTQMTNFKEMYKNPLFRVFITYMEVLPVGMIVALFCAFIVKKK